MEVAHDPEEVAGVDTVGHGRALLLRPEDGDRVDDGVAWVARDHVAHPSLGIEQREALESVVEQRTHLGVDTRGASLPRELLFAHALVRRGTRRRALLSRDVLRVEVGARGTATITSRRAVERAEEGRGDQQYEAPRERTRVGRLDLDRRDLLREEAE